MDRGISIHQRKWGREWVRYRESYPRHLILFHSWEADKEFLHLLWNRMVHYRVRRISLATDSCPEPFESSIHSQLTFYFNIIRPCITRFLNLRFYDLSVVCISQFLVHLILLVLVRAGITKFLVMQFSPSSRYFSSPWSKYFHNYPQCMFIL
jgi:hypothetical protein